MGLSPPNEAEGGDRFHKFRLDWDVDARVAQFFVDDVLQSTLTGEAVVPDFGTIWLGSW